MVNLKDVNSSYLKLVWVMGLASLMGFMGCGVKGPPTPYVDSTPEVIATPIPTPTPVASPLPTPTPTPTPKKRKKS